MIQIQPYQQRRELGQGFDTPGVQPNVANTGVGRAIEEGAARLQAHFEKSMNESAETESLAAAARVRSAVEQEFIRDRESAQPGAANFTPTFMDKVSTTVNAEAEKLTNDESRRRFRNRMLNYEGDVQGRSLVWESGQRIAKRVQDFETSADHSATSVYTTDGIFRDEMYRQSVQDINQSLDNIDLPPDVKESIREQIRTKISHAAVQGDLRDRPDRVQDWLIKNDDGSDVAGAGYYSMLRNDESGGRNIASSSSTAYGPYQFLEGTWENIIKAHPELGLTKADRFKPERQELAIRAFTADNAKYLERNGVPASNANLRMAHFLGPAGAAAFLKASPDADARSLVGPAAVRANPGVFKEGRTVGEVLKLMTGHYGDAVTWDKPSGKPTYYTDLTYEKRNALYSAAETEMNKRRVDMTAGFQQRVENSVAEFAMGGEATSPPSEAEFVNIYGPNKGSIAYGEYVSNATAATASYKLQNMPLNEQGAFIETFKPKPGDPFYAEKLDGYQKVRTVAEQIRTQMTTDFGGYVTARSPVAQQLLSTAFDPDKLPGEAAAAADQYAQIIQAEASRLNVGTGRSFLPKAKSESIAAMMNSQVLADGDSRGKVMALNAYAERWGSRWPAIYGELKQNLSAPVQVITSQIKERAATALASVHDKSFDDLSRTIAKADRQEIDEGLQDAFQPFTVSTMWQQSSLPGVTVFFEQAKKLAAVYTAQGVGATEAAEQAYDDLIGFKYRMIDRRTMNLRVPREFDNAEIESYLDNEREVVLNSSRFAATPDQLKLDPDASQKLQSRLLRNSKWVTLPDNSGVGILVNGSLLRDSKNRPVVKSWRDILSNIDEYEAAPIPEVESSIRPPLTHFGIPEDQINENF